MKGVVRPQRAAPGGRLSGRELQIIYRVAQGMTNRDVARSLGLAEDTIKSTLSRALRKTGARDRAHLVAVTLSAHRIPPVRAPHAGAVDL